MSSSPRKTAVNTIFHKAFHTSCGGRLKQNKAERHKLSLTFAKVTGLTGGVVSPGHLLHELVQLERLAGVAGDLQLAGHERGRRGQRAWKKRNKK